MSDVKKTKGSIPLIGVSVRTNNMEAMLTIPLLWRRFYTENAKEKIKNRTDNNILAVYTDYEGDYTKPYTVMIGCAVDSLDAIPEGLVGKLIPAQNYAAFTCSGEFPKSLQEMWGKIWQTPLNRAYGADIEIYDERFYTKQQEVEILISLK